MDYPHAALESLSIEFDELFRELNKELLFFHRTKRHRSNQHWRRAYCRTVCAYFEAVTSWMARYTISLFHPGQLGDDERDTLEARLSALKRGFHALDLFTNTSGAESPLQPDSAEWVSLDCLIKIRNRITHPKRVDDLLLTDDDLAVVERGSDVMHYLFLQSFKRCSRALTKQLREFEQQMARRKSMGLNDAANAHLRSPPA
jgi:hypothetical protein